MAGAQDILAQSDDDFLNSMPPVVEDQDRGVIPAAAVEEPAATTETQLEETPAGTGAGTGEGDENADPKSGEGDENTNTNENPEGSQSGEGEQGQGEGVDGAKKAVEEATDQGGEAADKSGKAADDKTSGDGKVEPKTGEAAEGEKTGEEAPQEQAKPINYEEVGKMIMAPFKANGKDIQLKSPEEAMRLMQMGANYTRKMQELQPTRNLVRMLESNGLTDPARLSYLIDLDKKNPEAIKKLVLDSGIDPLTIDPSVEPAYQPGNYQPSQEEDRFRTTLEEVNSLEGGQETVRHIHENWDITSKDALWSQPELLTLIHQQRANGVYDVITTELERRKVLGEFQGIPFLQAYKQVGDQLASSGGFQGLGQKQDNQAPQGQGDNPVVQPKPEPKVVETRAAAPKAPVANGDKAQAAAPTRSSPQTAKQLVNPLAMSDDDFLKSMNNRL